MDATCTRFAGTRGPGLDGQAPAGKPCEHRILCWFQHAVRRFLDNPSFELWLPGREDAEDSTGPRAKPAK